MRLALPLALLATAAGLAVAPASADVGERRPEPTFSFQTPSKRISCIYSRAQMRCDGPDRTAPRPPRSCEFDFGGAFRMRPTGRAGRICHGDTALDQRAPVLRYGRTVKRYGFTCTSRRTGLTCRNRSGRGWFISVRRSYVF